MEIKINYELIRDFFFIHFDSLQYFSLASFFFIATFFLFKINIKRKKFLITTIFFFVSFSNHLLFWKFYLL